MGDNCCAPNRKKLKSTISIKESEEVSKAEKLPEGMVYIPGGKFMMGTNSNEGFSSDGEGPIRKVEIGSFYMDYCTVTNEDFEMFVKDTGYKTDAEKYGWSFVFKNFITIESQKKVKHVVKNAPWWCVVESAYWSQPEGINSNIENRMKHPAVHLSWNDAVAYCNWAGKRLPTEGEWEYAARGGLEKKMYPWGNELTPNGQHYCNIWQGEFPSVNTKEDGYKGTAPAFSFPANGYGLYNMSGNIWEWCSDWFARSHHNKGGRNNPKGPLNGEQKVIRGGSYLCHASYCNRYRVAARSFNTPDSSTGNMGFRCVVDVKQ